MLIVGELINTSRKEVAEAVKAMDDDLIRDIAKKQHEAGAHYIDINCGAEVDDEFAKMKWLVSLVQESTGAPVCIDSPNPAVIEAALQSGISGQPMINSITAERQRFEALLPVVLKYGAKIVALCIDDGGLPRDMETRVCTAKHLINDLTGAGIPENDIYIDPLIMPISTDQQVGVQVLDTIRRIREEFPSVHLISGLSNISYGLPCRKVLNRTFLIQTMTAGMDAYILNPLDRRMMGFLYSSQALLGEDLYCAQYLKAYRRGIYD